MTAAHKYQGVARYPTICLAVGWLTLGSTQASATEPATLRSITNTSRTACKTEAVDRESGSSRQICPGVGGYKLLVLDEDNRMSVSLITPDRRELPLAFQDIVTRQFSSLGKAAEWRVEARDGPAKPVALIVELSVSRPTDKVDVPTASVGYFVVAKIANGSACVIDKIRSGKGALAQARRIAEAWSASPCLPAL